MSAELSPRPSARPAAQPGRRLSSERVAPYIFLLPHALLFLVFTLYPIVFGIYVSLHDWDVLATHQRFAGLEYYLRLFDPSTIQFKFFWNSLFNTIVFVIVSVPLLIAGALSLALILHRPLAGRGFFRVVFFMPNILSVSVVGLLWRWLFDNQSGLFNVVRTEYFDLPRIHFLTVQPWAWITIVVATMWWTIGFNMVIYIAALQGIPLSYYEAAEIDGAGWWKKVRFITWPLLAPATLFVAVTTMLGSFQLFGQPLIITGGGPSRSTQSIIMYITEEAFTNFQLSSAMAMALLFGLIMLIVTVIQFRMMARDLKGAR